MKFIDFPNIEKNPLFLFLDQWI